jgi:formylglycine-generating enzyme required for sulfatase activity
MEKTNLDRVIRGGSWGLDAHPTGDTLRSAFRLRNPPGYRWNDQGFRLAVVQPPSYKEKQNGKV